MIGSLIFMFMCLWVFALAGGVILGKIFWTPPGQE